ncbi:Mss4-like protein [Aspergillus karnatakaensis]|uniref:GFA family protein n=1 Tax=Aspergillus karnatakaensis TaxID=1810916 RepID=UPI003CCDD7AA
MAVGGCFCGKVRIETTGQPVTAGLCHCFDCRKLTGGVFSYSFVFKHSDFKITGTPKEIVKSADSGNTVKNHFCPDCGTPIYGFAIQANGVPGDIAIVRAGIFDNLEELNARRPVAELYVKERVSWLCPLEGAAQVDGMMELSSS